MTTQTNRKTCEVDLLDKEGTVLVAIENTFYEESMTAPFGSTYATDTWWTLDDSEPAKFFLDDKPASREQIIALIGEERMSELEEDACSL